MNRDRSMLTSAERELVAKAEEFARTEVAPHANEWERARRQPLETIRQAAALGLTGIQVPLEWGGLGLSFACKMHVAEVLSRHDMAFAFALINTHNCAERLAKTGPAGPRERLLRRLISGEILGCAGLTEPGAGSDFAAITTQARRVDGGWILNGEKAWITNAANAEVIVTYAQTDPSKGWRGIASFIVEGSKPGFERRPAFALAGAHAIGAGGFVLKDYFVADADVQYGPGEAFKHALSGINGARTYVAAMACGMLEESLRLALRHGEARQTFGQKLIEHQGWRWKMVEVATQLEAARLLCDRAAALIDSDGDAVLAAAQAKKFASEMIVPRLADCMQAMGAEGLKDIYPIGRHILCGRVANYVDGSTEIQNDRIGAMLVKEYG
jgi:alkylation response protein AidB-like acyl-CoA dehydrogenase